MIHDTNETKSEISMGPVMLHGLVEKELTFFFLLLLKKKKKYRTDQHQMMLVCGGHFPRGRLADWRDRAQPAVPQGWSAPLRHCTG